MLNEYTYIDSLTRQQFALISAAIPITIGLANYVTKRTGEIDTSQNMGELMIGVSREVEILSDKPVTTMELTLGKRIQRDHYRNVILVELLSGIDRLIKIIDRQMITLIRKKVNSISASIMNFSQFTVDMEVCNQALRDYHNLVQLRYDSEDYEWSQESIGDYMERCMEAAGKIDIVIDTILKYLDEEDL